MQSPKHHVRIITATSLFDGHDASISIMRRILQASGAEVVHLGHNRSVKEIVDAAIQEDVQAIAVSSYQGGHMEFFKYMVDLLKTVCHKTHVTTLHITHSTTEALKLAQIMFRVENGVVRDVSHMLQDEPKRVPAGAEYLP